MQASCSLKVDLWPKPIGLVQRSAATWHCGLHSSPRALVTTVVSRVVLRRVRNSRSYYYYYYYDYASLKTVNSNKYNSVYGAMAKGSKKTKHCCSWREKPSFHSSLPPSSQ